MYYASDSKQIIYIHAWYSGLWRDIALASESTRASTQAKNLEVSFWGRDHCGFGFVGMKAIHPNWVLPQISPLSII